MNKGWKTACAVWIFVFLISGFPGHETRASRAQNQNEISQQPAPFVQGRVLIQFRPEITKSHGRHIIAQAGAQDAGEVPGTGVRILELPAGADEVAFAKAFQSRPEVEFAELDRILPPEATVPNDFWYSSEWHLPRIAASTAWSTTTGSNTVTIAICDTGVDATHPDLSPKIVPGWNVYNNNSDTTDVHGHGTQVAGAAAACSNNSIGVASIAWGCNIMPIRVSDASGNASYSAIANGITWAANHGARVANVSYIATGSSTVTSAAQYMQSKNGVVTISAGNYSQFDSSPDNPYVLTISATNPSDVLSDFSNTGNNIDIAAPEGVYTTTRGGGYSYAGGTSFSAPIVAGVAALVISVNSNLTAAQVQDVLKQNADDLGAAGWDPNYGWGRVNAARAVNAASGGTTDNTPPTVSITSPAAGATVSAAASAQVSATDNIIVTSVSLSVDGVSMGTDTAAPYSFSWNTTALVNGPHTLTATASDAAGNLGSASISVTVYNAPFDTTPPTVTITSPANGASVSGNVSVVANAGDNVGVARVELHVDGSLTAMSTSAPFTTKWNARKASAGAHTLRCQAYDAAGNVGFSQTVTVYK